MTVAVASLGMYDHPAQHTANDRLWAGLVRRLSSAGIAAPAHLDRTRPVEAIWRDPALLFAQTCGYPLVTDPELALRVIGIPVYDAPDCSSGWHCSYIVGRDDEQRDGLRSYRDRRVAINARTSNSGYNLLRAAVAPFAENGRFFRTAVTTGSHRASVAAVRHGEADVAAIDAVSYAALGRFEPTAIHGLRIVARTARSPTLPFVTARSTNAETVAILQTALADTLADPELADARAHLFLTGFVPVGLERFETVRALERTAIAAGYPEVI